MDKILERMNNKLNIEIGTNFGKWKIISEETVNKNNITHWKSQCECGVIELVPLNNLMVGSSTQCKKCAVKESGLKRRKGVGDISGDMWAQFLKNKKNVGYIVDIRIEEVWDLFLKQDALCAISNLKITLSGYPYSRKNTTAKLVMINPTYEYVIDNVYWLHKDIAKMKGSLSHDDFLKHITKIGANQTIIQKQEYYGKHKN